MSDQSPHKAPKLNIYWDRRILSIAALGVISGLPWSLTHTTLGYWLTTEGVSMKTVGLFALTSLPYAFKFLWAPLFDLYQPPMIARGRSGWMVYSQLGLLGSLVAMSALSPKTEVELIALLAFLTSFFSASQDIAVDGWRVDVLEDDEQGVGASVATLGYRVGMFVSSAGALLMSAFLPWRWVYTTLAALVAFGMVVSLYTANDSMTRKVTHDHEEPFRRPLSPPRWLLILVPAISLLPIALVFTQSSLSPLLNLEFNVISDLTNNARWGAALLVIAVLCAFAFSAKRGQGGKSGLIVEARNRWGARWLTILSFVCVFRLGDHLLGFFLFPSLSELGFSPIEIAQVAKTWGLIATIIGTLFGGWLVYRIGLMRVMVIAGISQALSNLTLSAQALIGHSLTFLYVSIGIQDLALGMVNATFVAYLSSLCDRRYAATHFAFLSALSSVLKTFFQAGSGWVVVACKEKYGLQEGWALYFALTSILALPGLILLMILIRDSKVEKLAQE